MMNLLKPTITRRMVIGQLISVLVFSLLLAGNLLWEFAKTDGGEFDKGLLISAQAAAITLHAETTNAQELALAVRTLERAGLEATNLIKKDKQLSPYPAAPAMRVTDLQGRELYLTPGYSDIPLQPQLNSPYSFNYRGLPWRAINYRGEDQKLIVQIAQTTATVDSELLDLVITFIVWPLLWFLPLAALTSWWVVARGLRPLRVLADLISRRNVNDLCSLDYAPKHAELRPLVGEINFLLIKLNTTLTRERNFLADAAHELRTPLAVIQAQVHVLRHASNETEKSTASDELNTGIERAASLIQKLLLTAKVSGESFAPKLETIDLVAFVQERMAHLSLLANRKHIDMELKAPLVCVVKLDRETFISALDNVLDNAIRYTPQNGQIEVSIDTVQASKVRLRVADNGVGIASELHGKVFERFFRIPGTEQQGSGLGLAIVKRVLALHGGQVVLSPGLNHNGVAVEMTLPVEA
jgi:two-component system, OmpR family, sensor histidine kinase QseC